MTTCDLYKWEIEDGPSFFLTSGQVPISYEGDTYQPAPMRRGDLVMQAGEGQKIDIELPISHTLFEEWRIAPPSGLVRLTIIRHQGGAGEVLTVAHVAADRGEGSLFVLELVPMGAVSKKLPRGSYSTSCRWALYGLGCGLDEIDWRHRFSVQSVDPLTRELVLINIDPVVSSTTFAGGLIQPAGGGDRRLIMSEERDQATFTIRVTHWSKDLLDASTVWLYPGCDKSEASCMRFQNMPNFGGFPTLRKIAHSPFFDGYRK